MLCRLVVVFLLSSLPFATLAEVAFPEGPYGDHLKGIVGGFAQPTPERVAEVVRNHLSEDMQGLPMAAHLDYFQSVNEDLGESELRAITETGPGSYYVDFDRRGRDPLRLLIEFDPNPPHRMIGAQPIAFLDMERLDIRRPEVLAEVLAELAADNRFSGALYVEDGGKVLFREGYGLANKRYRVPNTSETRFAIGSITKMFTRMAALLLWEDGRLTFDDPVRGIVPELPESMAGMTVWHLLRHESGLTDYWRHPDYEAHKKDFLDVEDYLPVIASLPLDFEPGTARRYSNAGFVLLGIVLQRVSGQSYHDLIRERVFAPAGMKDTDFEQVTLVGRPWAVGYTNLSPLGPERGYQRENTDILPGIGTPAGTSYSTVDDLVAFDRALWAEGAFSETVRRLFFAIEQAESLDAAKTAPWPGAFSAAGGQPGENAILISVPSRGRRVVVLSNYDERLAEDIAVHLYRTLKAADGESS